MNTARVALLDDILAYEAGELSEAETVMFFQRLVDSGMAWRLQGHYGRTASRLINAGLVTLDTTSIDGETTDLG